MITAKMEFDGAAVEVTHQLENIYLTALLNEYTDERDPQYISDRNHAIMALNRLMAQAQSLYGLAQSTQQTISSFTFRPLVVVESLTIADDSGNDMIMKSPQSFTVTAHVRNLSTVSVSGVGAVLGLFSPNESTEIVGAGQASLGMLAAADDVAGGADEMDVTFEVLFDGDEHARERILLTVDILEDGEISEAIKTASRSVILTQDIEVLDAELDGMPDDFEAQHGLDPTVDDYDLDKDQDGLSNGEELRIGTSASDSDTDGDGIDDADELYGTNGCVTDPLNPDTDEDGLSDSQDDQPLGDEEDEPEFAEGEPEVHTEVTEVILSADQRLAVVEVSNVGGGELAWSATSDSPKLVLVNPESPYSRGAGDSLIIMAAADYDFDLAGDTEVMVSVVDVIGANMDSQSVRVILQGAELPDPPDTIDDGNGDDSGQTQPTDPDTDVGCVDSTCGGGCALASAMLMLGLMFTRTNRRWSECSKTWRL